MKIIQINNENKVIDILNARNDVSQDTIFVVDNIPDIEHIEGYNCVLMYNQEQGLYWEYIQAPVNNEISDRELGAMIKEVI